MVWVSFRQCIEWVSTKNFACSEIGRLKASMSGARMNSVQGECCAICVCVDKTACFGCKGNTCVDTAGREDALSIDSRWSFHIGLYSKRRVNAAGEGGMMRHPPCQQLGRHLTFKAVLMTLPSDWPVDPVHDFFKYQGSRMWSTCRSAFDHYWLPPLESGQLWRLARPKWGSETLHINIFGQSIATSHDLTPNGGLVREIPLFQGNLGWWNIIIWPDIYIYIFMYSYRYIYIYIYLFW